MELCLFYNILLELRRKGDIPCWISILTYSEFEIHVESKELSSSPTKTMEFCRYPLVNGRTSDEDQVVVKL